MGTYSANDILQMSRLGALDKLGLKNLRDTFCDNSKYILKQELASQFSPEAFEKMKLLIRGDINLVKTVVRETATLYKSPAKRSAYTEVAGKDAQGKAAKTRVEDPVYQEIREKSGIDMLMREANRYTRLMNNMIILTAPRNGTVEYDLLGFDNADVMTDPDDWKKVIGFKYYSGLQFPSTGDIRKYQELKFHKCWLYTIEGEKVFKYEVEGFGERAKVKTATREELNYKDLEGRPQLPITLLHKTFPIDKLLDFTTGNDIYDANLVFNIGLVSISELIKYQSFKQPWVVVPKDESFPPTAKVGPGEGHKIIDPTGNAKMGVLDTEANIQATWEVIKNRALLALAQYGISNGRFTLTGTPAAGITIKLDSRGVEEIRDEDRTSFTLYERDLYFKTLMVNNAEYPKKIMDVKAKFTVDFADTGYPATVDEINKKYAAEIPAGVSTAVDWVMEKNPDLTRDQAMEVVRKNLDINRELQALAGAGGNAALEAVVNARVLEGASAGGGK